MRSWKFSDMTKFQEEISESTRATRSADDPKDDPEISMPNLETRTPRIRVWVALPHAMHCGSVKNKTLIRSRPQPTAVRNIVKQVMMTRKREKVIRTREWKWRATMARHTKTTERDTRIEDTPAVPDEPTDHAVARGREVSLHVKVDTSPENHTVSQRQRSSQTSPHRQQNTLL